MQCDAWKMPHMWLCMNVSREFTNDRAEATVYGSIAHEDRRQLLDARMGTRHRSVRVGYPDPFD